MAPVTWLLGATLFERVAILILLLVYVVVLGLSAWLLVRRQRISLVGLAGAILDICMISALPYIWYASLGGSEIPSGIIFKSSVTLMSLLFIAINTLALRPLYPLVVTVGALLVHVVMLAAALDGGADFTSDYLAAYTGSAISSGRIYTQFLVLILAGGILVMLTARARGMIIEAANLQKIAVQLGRYFSPNLVRRLEQSPALLQVGGERKDLSFVFTDLQGFTSLVEKNDPAVVVPILNEYLNELVQVAFRHDGTVDKIVGDAAHIIFGAPMDQPDHADKAVACALEMDSVCQRFRESSGHQVELGLTRIGVNSGAAIVGNFGGEDYFDYTAHGDAINTAARLESINKQLGTRICVSDETVSRTTSFYGRPAGIMVLRGKSKETKLFEAVSKAEIPEDRLGQYCECYRNMENEEAAALDGFREYCARYPDDGLARFHLDRLKGGQSGSRIAPQ